MVHRDAEDDHRPRLAPLEMEPELFRTLGYRLVDRIADFLATLGQRPVRPDEPITTARTLLGTASLPERGESAERLLDEAARLVLEHSTLTAHPRYWAYITGSPSPLGALGDLLAASVNPNVASWDAAPAASAIEEQTVRWIAELLGYPTDCGGLLVSGGTVANLVGVAAARHAQADDVRARGTAAAGPLRIYAAAEVHTWLKRAADLLGLGTDAIHWVPTDGARRMDAAALRGCIRADRGAGAVPFLVVGSAGTVSTGAVDPLPKLAAVCREHGLWFHVDGAYGGVAVLATEAPADLRGLSEADSVAVDPHKWLYAPLEAGCALVRDARNLRAAFRYHSPYYTAVEVDDAPVPYRDYGPQTSRGFRALKVWLCLRRAGREGYAAMIADDIALARYLYRLVAAEPALEAVTHGLSVTTFRYVPPDLTGGGTPVDAYLDALNAEVLRRLHASGEAFPSHTVVDGAYVLRVCIVNFRTSAADVEALPRLVTRTGAEADGALRPARLKSRA